MLIWRVLIWRVLIWRVLSNSVKERSRTGWELSVPVAWWPLKEPGVMPLVPCNSAKVLGWTVSERPGVRLAGARAARLPWEPPSVVSSGVRCTRGRVAVAMHGWAWPSFGWRVSPAVRWRMGRVCG